MDSILLRLFDANFYIQEYRLRRVKSSHICDSTHHGSYVIARNEEKIDSTAVISVDGIEYKIHKKNGTRKWKLLVSPDTLTHRCNRQRHYI